VAIAFDYQILYDSPALTVADIQWHAHEARPTSEFQSPRAEITFQRRGLFHKRCGGREVACDPNTLLFIEAEQPYRLTHPIPGPCACTALLVPRDVLAGSGLPQQPPAGDAPARLFDFEDCPSTLGFTRTQEVLLALARRRDPADGLRIEELGLTLVRAAVTRGLRFQRGRFRGNRAATERAHRDWVQAVKSLLTQRFGARMSLMDLAKAVHCAPAHLCWVFRQQTGMSIHRYRTNLRLRAALAELADGQTNLARLAAELGFSSHSHFATVFRREMGFSPSQMARRERAEWAARFVEI